MVLGGGTGASDFLYEAGQILTDIFGVKRNFEAKEVAYNLSEVMIKMKREGIDSHLRSNYGVDTARAISGEGIDMQLKERVMKVLTGEDRRMGQFYSGMFILIGKDKDKVNLYNIPIAERPMLSSRPYGSVGSGSDESDKVLYSFVESLKKDQRKNIDPSSGMMALIRATNASSEINQGVGGVPTISYFNSNAIKILGEDESRLATEIVKVMDANLIKKSLAKDSISDLLYNSENFEDIENKAFNCKGSNYNQIMRFLREYKI